MNKLAVAFTLLTIFFSIPGNAENRLLNAYCIVIASQGNVQVNGETIYRGYELKADDLLKMSETSDFVSLLFSNSGKSVTQQ